MGFSKGWETKYFKVFKHTSNYKFLPPLNHPNLNHSKPSKFRPFKTIQIYITTVKLVKLKYLYRVTFTMSIVRQFSHEVSLCIIFHS